MRLCEQRLTAEDGTEQTKNVHSPCKSLWRRAKEERTGASISARQLTQSSRSARPLWLHILMQHCNLFAFGRSVMLASCMHVGTTEQHRQIQALDAHVATSMCLAARVAQWLHSVATKASNARGAETPCVDDDQLITTWNNKGAGLRAVSVRLSSMPRQQRTPSSTLIFARSP